MLLGFDIGGTKSAVIMGDVKEGRIDIADKEVLPTNKSVYDMIESLFASAESMLEKHAVSKKYISGIGISCGGPLNSKRGIILSPPNLPGWDNIDGYSN